MLTAGLLGPVGPAIAQPKPLQPNPQAPTLRPPFPLGAQRGTSIDLNLTGTNLNEPVGLFLSFPAKVTIPTEGNNGKDAAKLLVRLEIPADAPIGMHFLRLATTRGLSNLRLFCVDDLPQVLENNTNRTAQTAQEVPIPCVVVGKAAAEASNYFKVKVKAGQRLSFDLLGRRLGSAFDPQITLFDAGGGRELPGAYSNDAPGLQTDPRLTWTFKEAGEFIVQVRDVSWRGGDDFFFRLRIGDFPCATSTLPLAARRGSKTSIGFAGPAVEGVAPVEVMTPADPTIESVQVAPRSPNGLHGWPVTLLLSDLDETKEQKPNSEPSKANRVPVPGAVSGCLTDKGGAYFVFAAKKGQRLVIDSQTAELGSPAELYLVLRDAKGGQVAASNPMQPTARVDFTAAADGDYTVAVEHLHLWSGPAESYRLTILPYEPGFDLTLALDRFDISQGGTLTLPIQAVRRDYTGPVELSVVGPRGLSGSVTLAAGQPMATLTVQAGPDLDPGLTTFHIRGQATINGHLVSQDVSVRQAVSASLAGLPLPPRETFTAIGLVVREGPPFALTAKFDQPAGTPGKPLMLTVTVTRSAGFTGEVTLTATGLPANVTAALKPIPAGQNEIKVEIAPKENAAVGTFPITLSGKGRHRDRDVSANAAPVMLVLKK